MSYKVGDFVKYNGTKYPGLIVKILNSEKLLVSIVEYRGDYKIVSIDDVSKINLKCHEKLYILSNYGSWFYGHHKSLYQSIIIEAIKKKCGKKAPRSDRHSLIAN